MGLSTAVPKRGGFGGGRGGSFGKGWDGSSKSYGGSNHGKCKIRNNLKISIFDNLSLYFLAGKSSFGKKLLKGAAIGAGAYGVYKLGQLSTRFDGNGFGGYGVNDWNSWREADGMLCRKDSDCNWLDRHMYCQDYELDFSPNVSPLKMVKKCLILFR